MLFCSNSAHFSEIQLVCDGRTDRPTDGLTDGRTDAPSYRDARTHLKINDDSHKKMKLYINIQTTEMLHEIVFSVKLKYRHKCKSCFEISKMVLDERSVNVIYLAT